MKTAKHVTALILCLCLLVGLPISVQAIGTSNASGLYIHAAVARPNKNGADTSFVFYVSKDVTQYNLPATSFEGTNVEYYMNIYDSNGNLMDGGEKVELKTNNDNNAMDGESYGATSEKWARIPAIRFTDATMTFSGWKAKGAARFEFCLVETDAHTKEAYEGNDRNDYVWKAETGGNTLWAYEKINGQDATIVDIITQDEWLTIDSVAKTAKDKITVTFSEPVAMAGLKADGGPVDVWVRIVDGSNNLITYTMEDGTTIEYQYPATTVAPYAGNSAEVEFTVPELATAYSDLASLAAAGNDYTLKIFIADDYDNLDCTNRGEAAGNCVVDGIWSVATKCPLIATQKMEDYQYGELSRIRDIDQLNLATEGDIVKVHEDTDMTSQTSVLMVPAGVTLNLNGSTLKVDNLISFGNIIDSSEGGGGIIISKDEKVSAIHLQPTNTAMPMYDDSIAGYRFFTYIVDTIDTVQTHADNAAIAENAVKYGIRVIFESPLAYELLAADEDIALIMSISVNGKIPIRYKFKSPIMVKLKDAVAENFDNRTNKVITLTIYGLTEGMNLTAMPILYSAEDVLKSGDAVTYTHTAAGAED